MRGGLCGALALAPAVEDWAGAGEVEPEPKPEPEPVTEPPVGAPVFEVMILLFVSPAPSRRAGDSRSGQSRLVRMEDEGRRNCVMGERSGELWQ